MCTQLKNISNGEMEYLKEHVEMLVREKHFDESMIRHWLTLYVTFSAGSEKEKSYTAGELKEIFSLANLEEKKDRKVDKNGVLP